MQREMPLISSMQGQPKPAEPKLLRQITSEAQAIDVSIRMCGKAGFVAASMGRSEGYVSLLRKGKRAIPNKRRHAWITEFCRITGTTLLAQFVRMQEAMTEPTEAQTNERLAEQARAA